MTFYLGRNSEKELQGVHESLVRVVRRAIAITPIDFGVYDGLRTIEEQRKLVDVGASRTLNSMHLSGKAVDLVPYINSKYRWEWGPIYRMASAVQRAAELESVELVWGAVWDRFLGDLSHDLEAEVERYVDRRRKKSRRAFLDGPHFQLPN